MAMNKDDAEYVEQVMASQSILHVKSNDSNEGTSSSSEARKRRFSSDDESENGVPAKKEKSDNEFAELLRAGFTQLQVDLTKTLDQKFESFEDKLRTAILSTVQEEIKGVRLEFNDRISGLSKKLEDKLSTNLQTMIDSRLKDAKTEMSSELNLDALKSDVSKLQQSYAEVTSASASHASLGRRDAEVTEHCTLNVVVRNLKYDAREQNDPNVTVNLVNSVIRDGLKLTDAKIVQAERKIARNSKPGVIIATVENSVQKQNVLKNKKSLRKIKKYENVYIEDERSHEQRLIESNIRTVLQAIGKSKDYVLINGRFVKKTSTSTQSVASSSK